MATLAAKAKAKEVRRSNRKTIDSVYMGKEPVFSKGDTPTDPKLADRLWLNAANWYNYYYDPKQYVPYVLKYGTEVLGWTADQAKQVKALKDYEISMSIGPGKACVIWSRGFEYLPERQEQINAKMAKLLEHAENQLEPVDDEEDTKPVKVVISPQQRMRAKMMDTIYADFEDTIVDGWLDNKFNAKLDVYGLCKKYMIKGNAINMFQEKVNQLLEEYNDAYNKTCEQAVEAYSYVSRANQKKAIKQLEAIISDCEALKASAKATRMPRAKKPRALDKQVEKLKYLKESIDFKLTSINPIMIPTSFRLYVFNTKQKKLFEYVTNSTKGFEVKGTTLQNFDAKLSRCITLRKPDEVLPNVLNKTPKQIDNLWNTLTTKTGECNGRINQDCILLRVLDK